MAEGNKQLSEAATEVGVRSQMIGVFHDAGYLGQYTLDAENIRIYKGIPERVEILNYMGREELASNLSSGSRRWKDGFAGSTLSARMRLSRRIIALAARFETL